jgi:type I restriction enzyme M protein
MPTKSNELKIEDKLWEASDKLRGSMDQSTYRNVVLGLIFFEVCVRYIRRTTR